MRTTTRIAPPNSLILVMDQSVGVIPGLEGSDASRPAATRSCIAVCTLAAVDGETSILLSDEAADLLGHPGSPIFDGVIDTPAHRISVVSTQLELLAEVEVAWLRTRVRIWTNDPVEPDEIAIVVGP
jgi:hypothetical protein